MFHTDFALLEPPLTFRRIEAGQPNDLVQLEQLFLANPAYAQETQQRPPLRSDARHFATSHPAGTAPAQKYAWGLWVGPQLVGFLDVVRAWPRPQYLYIGLLLIDQAHHRQGLASQALKLLEKRTQAWKDIRRWRIAVHEHRASTLAFWRQAGFQPTGEKAQLPQFKAALLMMERGVRRH